VGDAGQWLSTALAIVFFLALLLAGGLFFTSQGLQAHAGWARILAGLLAFGMMLTALVAMAILGRGLLPLFAALAVVCAYAIWAMLLRFA
jgi:hypothetical protein